jgi:hypothetical protein
MVGLCGGRECQGTLTQHTQEKFWKAWQTCSSSRSLFFCSCRLSSCFLLLEEGFNVVEILQISSDDVCSCRKNLWRSAYHARVVGVESGTLWRWQDPAGFLFFSLSLALSLSSHSLPFPRLRSSAVPSRGSLPASQPLCKSFPRPSTKHTTPPAPAP